MEARAYSQPVLGDICIDQEFQQLIPPLSEAEYQALEENIIRDGCREPLSIWQGTVIDGHNRLEICTRLKIEYRTEEIRGLADRSDVIIWIIRQQLGRRNISDFVRVELAQRVKPLLRQKARENQGARNDISPNSAATFAAIDVRREIAVAARVSPDTVRKVQLITEHAAPEVLSAVRQGEISINAASKVVSLSKDEQTAAAMTGPAGLKAAAKSVAATAKAESSSASSRALPNLTEDEAEGLYVQHQSLLQAYEQKCDQLKEVEGAIAHAREVGDELAQVTAERDALLVENAKLKARLQELEQFTSDLLPSYEEDADEHGQDVPASSEEDRP